MSSGYDDVQHSRVLAVDPTTGEHRRTVLDAAGLLTSLESDATGTRILLIATTPRVEGVIGQVDSRRVLTAATGEVRPLREDISTATW